jgi:MFS family permease
VSGPLLDRWGRRTALLGLNVPGLAGWLLLASSDPDTETGFLWQVYTGRLLTGLSTGMASVPATVRTLTQGWANSGPLRVFFMARQDSQKNPP